MNTMKKEVKFHKGTKSQELRAQHTRNDLLDVLSYLK